MGLSWFMTLVAGVDRSCNMLYIIPLISVTVKGHNCEPGFPIIPSIYLISHTEIYGLFFLGSAVYVIQPYTIRRHMMGDPPLVIGLREATKLKRPRLQGAAGLLQQLVPNKSCSNSWFSSEKKLYFYVIISETRCFLAMWPCDWPGSEGYVGEV